MTVFMFLVSIPGFLMTYAVVYNNQVEPTFNIQFGWFTQKEQHWNHGLLGSSIIFGMAFGAISSGRFMQMGHRKGILVSCPIGIVGCSITMYEWFWPIMVGRFLFGFTAGL